LSHIRKSYTTNPPENF